MSLIVDRTPQLVPGFGSSTREVDDLESGGLGERARGRRRRVRHRGKRAREAHGVDERGAEPAQSLLRRAAHDLVFERDVRAWE